MNKIYLMFVFTFLLVGCAPHLTAGWDMNTSKEKYKECLEANPDDHQKCEQLRKLFEVDRSAVEAIGDRRPKGVILLNK